MNIKIIDHLPKRKSAAGRPTSKDNIILEMLLLEAIKNGSIGHVAVEVCMDTDAVRPAKAIVSKFRQYWERNHPDLPKPKFKNGLKHGKSVIYITI